MGQNIKSHPQDTAGQSETPMDNDEPKTSDRDEKPRDPFKPGAPGQPVICPSDDPDAGVAPPRVEPIYGAQDREF